MTPTARVGDIADQIRGVTYAKDEASDTPRDQHLPLLRAGNIGDSGLIFDDILYVPSSRVSERQHLRPNDVLIAASSGSLSVVGKAARVVGSDVGSFGAFCKVLRLTGDVHPGYFAHYFRTPEYRRYISSVAAGANINNLRGEDLDRIEIPLPPLPEQRRISAILDEADALLTRARAGFARFAQVRDAAFRQSTRASVTTTLGSVSRMYGGSSLPDGEAFVGQADGYLCLKVSDMNRRDNEAGIANSSLWSAAPGSRASTAPAGAIVIPKRGGAIGTNKKMQLLRPAILDPNLMAIEADGSTLLPATLLAWFKTIDLKTIQSGSSVPQLNKQDLIPLEVPIPPLDVQGDFSLSMSELRVSEASSRRRLVVLDSLFASLQHRAFRGEL